MDDIKNPTPTGADNDSNEPKDDLDETSPVNEVSNEPATTQSTPVETKTMPEPTPAPVKPEGKGVKPGMVAFFVVLALILGGLIAYVVADQNSTDESSEALQMQIDELNQQLTDAQEAAEQKTQDEKDQEITDLTAENEQLKTDNQSLTDENTQLQADNQALTDACEAAEDCEVPESN